MELCQDVNSQSSHDCSRHLSGFERLQSAVHKYVLISSFRARASFYVREKKLFAWKNIPKEAKEPQSMVRPAKTIVMAFCFLYGGPHLMRICPKKGQTCGFSRRV